MNSKKLNSEQIRKLTLAAMLTAIVVVLQLLFGHLHSHLVCITDITVPSLSCELFPHTPARYLIYRVRGREEQKRD